MTSLSDPKAKRMKAPIIPPIAIIKPMLKHMAAGVPGVGSPGLDSAYASHMAAHFVKSFNALFLSCCFQRFAVRVVQAELGSVLGYADFDQPLALVLVGHVASHVPGWQLAVGQVAFG